MDHSSDDPAVTGTKTTLSAALTGVIISSVHMNNGALFLKTAAGVEFRIGVAFDPARVVVDMTEPPKAVRITV